MTTLSSLNDITTVNATRPLDSQETEQVLYASFQLILDGAKRAAAKTNTPIDDMAVQSLVMLQPVILNQKVIDFISSDEMIRAAVNEIYANKDGLTAGNFKLPYIINTVFKVVVEAASVAVRFTPTIFDDLAVAALRSIQPMIIAILVEEGEE